MEVVTEQVRLIVLHDIVIEQLSLINCKKNSCFAYIAYIFLLCLWAYPPKFSRDCRILLMWCQVLEETGFDISELVSHEEFLECRINEQLCRLYIVPGVSLDTKFQAKTRNEIKVICCFWFVDAPFCYTLYRDVLTLLVNLVYY